MPIQKYLVGSSKLVYIGTCVGNLGALYADVPGNAIEHHKVDKIVRIWQKVQPFCLLWQIKFDGLALGKLGFPVYKVREIWE